MVRRELILTFAAVIILSACSTSTNPKVSSDVMPGTNFSAFKTFSFVTEMPPGGANPVAVARIQQEVGSALSGKGYTQGQPSDLTVVTRVGAQDRTQIHTWGWWGQQLDVQQYTEGKLAVDVFDTKNQRPLWHGQASEKIDPNKLEVKSKWPLAPCTEPSGLSIDRKHHRLFVGCDNKMMAVVDADSGKVLATPAIGEGVDATAFDEGTGLAFASCGQDAVLTVVKQDSPDKYSVAENVTTKKGARTLALDTKTHNVYVVTADFGPRPAATADNPHPRPTILPDSFVVLVVGK